MKTEERFFVVWIYGRVSEAKWIGGSSLVAPTQAEWNRGSSLVASTQAEWNNGLS